MTETSTRPAVSRETQDRLKQFTELLTTWTRRINLIAPGTVSDAWTRHIRDSEQFWDAAPDGVTHWCDLGSGGGLPGMVVAIRAAEDAPEMKMTLIESDQRKVAFLRTAAQALELSRVSFIAKRLEDADPVQATVVSARALAPLPRLLPMVDRHLDPAGTAILAKGANVQSELDAAQRNWRFDLTKIPSRTEENGCLLRLRRIERV